MGLRLVCDTWWDPYLERTYLKKMKKDGCCLWHQYLGSWGKKITMSLRLAWALEEVPGQTGLHSNTLSQENKKRSTEVSVTSQKGMRAGTGCSKKRRRVLPQWPMVLHGSSRHAKLLDVAGALDSRTSRSWAIWKVEFAGRTTESPWKYLHLGLMMA